MGAQSKIEWTKGDDGTPGATWNPVTGCTHVSEGCRNCYAERVLPRTGQSFDKVVCHPNRLDAPLHWRKPRRIFVNSLSDLFHEDVPEQFIEGVFKTMCHPDCNKHTFQILTKRPSRMLEYVQRMNASGWIPPNNCCSIKWPLPNVWLGVSCEDQRTADERIPLLLQTPAAVRFISAEPLLGPIDLTRCLPDGPHHEPDGDRFLDWVIVGGESGPRARPMHPDWARSLRDQCQDVGVPYFFKQHGEWCPPAMIAHYNGHENQQMHTFDDGTTMFRVGKHAAGRILDGRTWDEMPC